MYFKNEKAVVAIVLDSNNNVLSVPRKTTKMYGLPGGKVDLNETDEEAIKRELFEETGIVAKSISFVYRNSEKADSEDVFFSVSAYLVSDYSMPLELKGDVGKAVFITWDELCGENGAFNDYNKMVRLMLNF